MQSHAPSVPPDAAHIGTLAVLPASRRNLFTRSRPGTIGLTFVLLMFVACLGSLPFTLGAGSDGTPRYSQQFYGASQVAPAWTGRPADSETPRFLLGSDALGRSLLLRCLAGGGVSLTIGIAAAGLSVLLGTLFGATAGYLGGRTDAFMMRTVDVLYGIPYILLVVLLAVASGSLIDEFVSRQRTRAAWVHNTLKQLAESERQGAPLDPSFQALRASKPDPASPDLRTIISPASGAPLLLPGHDAPETINAYSSIGALVDAAAQSRVPARELSAGVRTLLDLTVLFVAIGGVSWLTMARVVRGQVLSLKSQPFMEAARAMGVPVTRQLTRHLLPNLIGPIIVYATLTVPQAILQESFLSFLGIGVRPPLPSWGNLAAEGLTELNPYQSRWWLLLFPCLLLGLTLLALNFVGEGLREALDPKRRRR